MGWGVGLSNDAQMKGDCMKTVSAFDRLKEIAGRSVYHRGFTEAAFSEGLDLITACRRMTIAVTDDHLTEWKRGRGILSSGDMSIAKSRAQWLKFARECRDLALALGGTA
jgi:hypothetical protein